MSLCSLTPRRSVEAPDDIAASAHRTSGALALPEETVVVIASSRFVGANPPSATTSRHAWTITILLLGFMLLNFADKSALGLAGGQIQRELHIGPAQFGLVQSAFFWLFAAGALTIGAFSARISPRWLLAGLMVVWLISMVPLLGSTSFGVLLASRILLGFAEGPAFGLATHTVHSWFPAHRRAIPAGIVTSGVSVGPLVAAPVLTWVIVTWSWHASFGVLIVSGLVWTVAWLVVSRHNPPIDVVGAPTVEREPMARALPLVRASYRTLLSTGSVIGIALLSFFCYWPTALKVSWLPLYLTDGLGFDIVTAGWLITFPYALAALAAIACCWLSNRLTARGVSRRVSRGIFPGGLVIAAGASMVGFTLLHPGPLQVVFIAVAFSLNTAAFAISFLGLADVVHPAKRGPILGGIVAFYSIAGVVAPFLLGLLVNAATVRVDGYNNGFALSGVLMVVGAAIGTVLIHPERDAERIRIRTQDAGEVLSGTT
jgi:MFS family permease